MTLGILTFNIRGLPWIRCPIEAILLWISWKVDCDIICLQEVFGKGLRQTLLDLCPRFQFIPYFADEEPSCFGKKYLRFGTPCGLCILVKPHVQVLRTPQFHPFLSKSGLDGVVNKGFLSLDILYKGHQLNLINTHLQSDFTEFPCFRIRYGGTRDLQEAQLFYHSKDLPFPIVCGDFNKNSFLFFERFDEEEQITFPSTGEHLDHLLLLKPFIGKLKLKSTKYFSDVFLSDHFPVLFSFDL